MSERILAVLLRLYPARFRERYQAEALQLVRDRLREERGVARKARFWLEVLVDLALGLPQAYRNSYATTAQVAAGAKGFPSFASLDPEPLRPGSVLLASLVAAGSLVLFGFLMTHVSGYYPFGSSTERLSAAPNGRVDNPAAPSAIRKAEWREAAQVESCGFSSLGVLPGNLGFVKNNWLAAPATCGSVARDVIRRLNDADAILLDLRNCGAGNHEMAQLVESSLSAKPVFVLVSPRSTPAAQEFAADLKTQRHATIVAEGVSARGGSRDARAASEISVVRPMCACMQGMPYRWRRSWRSPPCAETRPLSRSFFF